MPEAALASGPPSCKPARPPDSACSPLTSGRSSLSQSEIPALFEPGRARPPLSGPAPPCRLARVCRRVRGCGARTGRSSRPCHFRHAARRPAGGLCAARVRAATIRAIRAAIRAGAVRGAGQLRAVTAWGVFGARRRAGPEPVGARNGPGPRSLGVGRCSRAGAQRERSPRRRQRCRAHCRERRACRECRGSCLGDGPPRRRAGVHVARLTRQQVPGNPRP